jgi:hypothetical protein
MIAVIGCPEFGASAPAESNESVKSRESILQPFNIRLIGGKQNMTCILDPRSHLT